MRVFFGSSLLAVLLVATTGACDALSADATRDDNLCTPGHYVFCRCADRTPGTKLCRPDAKSFEACASGSSGACAGGEIPDPETNKPVAPPPSARGSGATVDACPGQSVALSAGAERVGDGDTSTAIRDRSGKANNACSAGGGANDHVYRVTPERSGSLAVVVQGTAGLDPVTYLQASCDEPESQVDCGPPTPKKTASFDTNVLAGRDYFLVVDGAAGSKGRYVASLKLTPGPFCGDGNVDPGEACDDLNHVADDGCGSDCRNVSGNPASGGGCPGHPVTVWPGFTVTAAGSTRAYGNTWSAPSTACSFGGSNAHSDHVYEVTPQKSGDLVVSLAAPAGGALANLMLTARPTCTSTSGTTANMCSPSSGTGATMTLPVAAGTKVYVAVDGAADANNVGDYVVSFVLR